jgi:hypothetical protein
MAIGKSSPKNQDPVLTYLSTPHCELRIFRGEEFIPEGKSRKCCRRSKTLCESRVVVLLSDSAYLRGVPKLVNISGQAFA